MSSSIVTQKQPVRLRMKREKLATTSTDVYEMSYFFPMMNRSYQIHARTTLILPLFSCLRRAQQPLCGFECTVAVRLLVRTGSQQLP